MNQFTVLIGNIKIQIGMRIHELPFNDRGVFYNELYAGVEMRGR
jgi:hypothetical protein